MFVGGKSNCLVMGIIAGDRATDDGDTAVCRQGRVQTRPSVGTAASCCGSLTAFLVSRQRGGKDKSGRNDCP